MPFRLRSRVHQALFGLLVAIAINHPAAADDEQRAARVPLLPKYQQECAACHVAYSPGMLPAASWQRVMHNLPHHYGTDASLDPATVKQLATWLTAYAGTDGRVREAPPRIASPVRRGGQPEHHTGHNPAGALAIVALLGLTLAVTASGWATYNDIAGEWLEEVHEAATNVMLAVIGVHVAGVLLSSWLHRENLVGSMINGRKPGLPEQAIRRPWRSVAVLMLVAVLGFWWLQWQSAPSGAGLADRPAASAQDGNPDRG
jgi:hypothetical protein